MTRILFIDDEPRVLSGIRRALRRRKDEWDLDFAVGGRAGLESFVQHGADVVVTDLRMPGLGGIEVLSRIAMERPDTIRIAMSAYSEVEASVRSIRLVHQFIGKPCRGEELEAMLDRAVSLVSALNDHTLREDLGGLEALPSVPALYGRLMSALASDGGDIRKAARIIADDPGAAAMVLKVVNSAFMGLRRQVSNVERAVMLLGSTLLQSLVLCFDAARSLGVLDAPDFSFDKFQSHSMLVATVAHRMAPGGVADAARSAGLLHDLGTLFLASQRGAQLQALVELAREDARDLTDVQHAFLDTTHAELGGYLLGIWGLPFALVEAVSFHHRPQAAGVRTLHLAGVVHVADALVSSLAPEVAMSPSAPIDHEYLAQIGMVDRLPGWREIASEVVEGGGRVAAMAG